MCGKKFPKILKGVTKKDYQQNMFLVNHTVGILRIYVGTDQTDLDFWYPKVKHGKIFIPLGISCVERIVAYGI